MTLLNNSSNQSNSRIAMVSTYPPTGCGIATFSQSLVNAFTNDGHQIGVIRLMNDDNTTSPDVVVHEHYGRKDSYRMQSVINSYDAAIIQHEFGIYNGRNGEDIIAIMDAITVPIIVVLHTVLSQPTQHQRFVLNQIIARADALVTMTHAGKNKLINGYEVDEQQVHVIAHGARPLSRSAHPAFRQPEKTRPRILTWGLIGPGKGIEWVIDALSELQDLDPKPEYVIAGQTHPHVKLHQGEQYRQSLIRKIQTHKLETDVKFVDQYLSDRQLEDLLASADIVVLPYDSVEQVTSGVLVEAVVANKPIIATHFPHATEMLDDGSGVLVPQQNSSAIAQALRELLTDSEKANWMKAQLQRKSPSFLWSSIGDQYLDIAARLQASKSQSTPAFIAS